MSIFSGIELPRTLYKTQSPLSGDIEVLQIGNTRRLRVNRTTQSLNPDSPYVDRMVWGRAVRLIQEEEPNFKSILILGLGGGTMQHILAQRFQDIHITTVDIDPVIVDVAKQYFDVDKIPNHNIIVEDACRVIIDPEHFKLHPQSFDVVMVDIMIGSVYPDLGTSGNFLAHVCKMAAPAGLVVINRLYLEDHQEEVNQFIDNVHNFLHDVKSIIIPGKTNSDNILIYGRV